MKKLYRLSTGKVYRVTQEKEAAFLDKHPNAEFIRVDVEDESGKTSGSVVGATAGQQTQAPIIMMPIGTDSSQGDGSLGSRFSAYDPNRTVYTGDEKKDTWIHTTLQNNPDKWVYDEAESSLRSRSSISDEDKPWDPVDALLPSGDWSAVEEGGILEIPSFLKPGWLDTQNHLQITDELSDARHQFRDIWGTPRQNIADVGAGDFYEALDYDYEVPADVEYYPGMLTYEEYLDENYSRIWNKYRNDVEFDKPKSNPFEFSSAVEFFENEAWGKKVFKFKPKDSEHTILIDINRAVEEAQKEISGGEKPFEYNGQTFSTDAAGIGELEAVMISEAVDEGFRGIEDSFFGEVTDPNSGITYVMIGGKGLVNKDIWASRFESESNVVIKGEGSEIHIKSKEDVLKGIKEQTTDDVYATVVEDAIFWENLTPYSKIVTTNMLDANGQTVIGADGKPILVTENHMMIGNTSYVEDPQKYMELRFLWKVHKHATELRDEASHTMYEDLSDTDVIQHYYTPTEGTNVAEHLIDGDEDMVPGWDLIDEEFDALQTEDFFSALDYEAENQREFLEKWELSAAEITSSLVLNFQAEATAKSEEIIKTSGFEDEAITAHASEIEEYKISFEAVKEQVVANMKSQLPKDANEMQVAAWGEEVDKAIKQAWEEHVKPVQEKISEYISNRVYDSEEWKEWKKGADETMEVETEKLWGSFIESQKYDYDRWDTNELDNIANYLEINYGFKQLPAVDKMKILNHVWKDFEDRGNINTAEDLDDYRNEFYYYFYSNIIEAEALSDGGNKTDIFYNKSMIEEIRRETADIMDPDSYEIIDEEAREKMYMNPGSVDWERYDDSVRDEKVEIIQAEMDRLGRKLTSKETEDILRGLKKRWESDTRVVLKQTLQWAERALEEPETAYQAGGFGAGFISNRGVSYVPFISGFADLGDSWKIKSILDKPKHLRSDAENNLLVVSSLKQTIDQGVADTAGVAYNAGKMFAHSVPFIVEFVATAGAFAAAKKATKIAAKKLITKAINNKLKQQGLRGTLRVSKQGKILFGGSRLTGGWQIADKAADGLAFLSGTVAQTFMQPHRIANNTIQQMTDEHMFAFTTEADGMLEQLRYDTIQASSEEGKAIGLKEGEGALVGTLKGFGLTWAEIVTEQVGAYLPGLGKGLLNKIGVKGGPLGDLIYNNDFWERVALGRLMRRYGLHRADDVIQWSQKAAGWHGFSAEFVEELINMPLTNFITGNDNLFQGIMTYNQEGQITGIDTKNLKTIGVSVGAGAMLFQGGGTVISTAMGYRGKSYTVGGKRFTDRKLAMRYLRTMKAKGLLNENIELVVKNDFQAYDQMASYLEKNGLSADIIKHRTAKTMGDSVTATEAEIMAELTEDQRQEVEEHDKTLEGLEQKKNEVKNSDKSKRQKAKEIKAIQKEIANISNAKNDIIGDIARKIERKKTSVIFQEAIAEIEKINNDLKKKGKKNVDIKRARNKRRARNLALGRILARELGVYKKNGLYYSIQTGQPVYVTVEQENLINKAVEEAEQSHGYFIPGTENTKPEIIINEDFSLDRRGGNVARHEFLHFFFDEMLSSNAELKIAMGQVFKSHLENLDPSLIRSSDFRKRLNGYKGKSLAAQSEEAMTLYLDALVNGELAFNESVLTKIGAMIRHAFHRMGVEMKFANGKDVLNFLKDFQHNVQGGEFSASMIKAFEGEFKISGEIKATQENITKAIDKNKAELRKQLSATFGEDLVTGEEPIMTEEEFDKLLDVMSSKGILFSKDVTKDVNDLGNMGWDQESWDSQGADFAMQTMIEEQMLDGLIAGKLRFKDSKSSQEIEDFIAKVYANLLPLVRNFNRGKWGTEEQNDSLYGWINAQIANRATEVWNAAQKPQQEKWAADIESTTSEGAPRFQIAAEQDQLIDDIDNITLKDIVLTEEQKVVYSQFRQDLGLNEDMMNAVRDVVVQTFGRKLPKVGTKEFKLALQEAFRSELKTSLQNMMGVESEFDQWLEDYFEIVYTQLSKETLIQMERKVPKDKRIFTSSRRITKVKEVDALIEQGLLPKDTNRKSGPNLITKLPYPGTAKVIAWFRGSYTDKNGVTQSMMDLLGYEVGSSTWGTRKDGLAEYMGQELAFDAVYETLERKDVKDRFLETIEMVEGEVLGNEIAMVLKQIDRQPGIMFSKSQYEADTRYLFDEVKAHGIENVFSNGKLSSEYEGRLPEAAATVLHIFDSGKVSTEQELQFKRGVLKIENLNEEDQAIVEAYGKIGNLRNLDNLGQLQQLHRDNIVIAQKIGEQDLGLIGYDILGYVYRVMDAAAEKRDGSQGDFHNALNTLKNKTKGLKGKGKSLDAALRIMNKGKSLFKGVIKIQNMDISRVEKIEKFNAVNPKTGLSLAQEVEAANKANIEAATKISKIIIDLSRSGKISKMSALHLLQIQTGIVNGFRGLSSLDLIEWRDGSQAATVNHSSYNEAVDFYLNEMNEIKDKDTGKKRKRTRAEAETKALESLSSKGEHLKPNSNTMLELAGMIFQNNPVTTEQIQNAFKDHSQFIGSKYLMDVLDHRGGKTNKSNFDRIKFLNQNDQAIIAGIQGTSYEEVMLDRISFSKPVKSVNKSNAAKLKNEQKARLEYNENTESKGMSTFDFDETLIIEGKNFVTATHPVTGEVVKINSENWPLEGPKMAAQGYQFDFSDFVNVRGGVEGPLLQKMRNQIEKYGAENVFILTARQQESATAIYEWLKTQGISIPFENITGLGKSEGSAKAEWMLEKYAEGYNDMYFVDDALPNVEAVKKVLDALDIKSNVVQARIMFSKDASGEFNEMLERNKDVDAKKTFSSAEARRRGAKKGRYEFFIPPSAEDFKGLMYKVLGRGKQGEQDLAWVEENLITPYAKGIRDYNAMKQKIAGEYRALNKKAPKLKANVAGTNFTVEQAIRVYLFDKAGFEIPGLAKTTKNTLINHVNGNSDLISYANALSDITRTAEGYVAPNEFWDLGTIASDMRDLVEVNNREGFLAEWKANRDAVFSEENLNKLEAIFGTNYRDALENMLYRMETGKNRTTGAKDKVVNSFLDWINGSVGSVMFFNTRSAVLQTISTMNFVDMEDNNIFKAAGAFANAPQFWKDFAYIFNSDTLKQRRSGLQMDVNAEELTDAFNTGKGPKAVIQYLLQIGFTPTQLADSFAISLGGATYYRNKVKANIKRGMSQQEAEAAAWLSFQEKSEETQQSSRPDFISSQQAGVLGRLVLAWQNTPMQMTRLTKKAMLDIINGRGDMKANVSKLIYYGVMQNIIFGTLQSGLMFAMFGDDEEEIKKKEVRVANGVLDTLLRGTGVYGAAAATLKNTIIQWSIQKDKPYGQQDWSKVSQEIINLSPPMGSKHRKIIGSIKGYEYNEDVISEMDYGIDNPMWSIAGDVIEGITNIPLGRTVNKANNIDEAINGNMEMWQRAALLLGWNKWDIGVKDSDVEAAKEVVKAKKEQEAEVRREQKKIEKEAERQAENEAIIQGNIEEQDQQRQDGVDEKEITCAAIKRNGERCSNKVLPGQTYCTIHEEVEQRDDGEETQCTHIKTNGKRCKMKTKNKSGKCYYHD